MGERLTRFCVVPDLVRADGTMDDVAAFFAPDDPELPYVLGRSGVESTPVFETGVPFAQLSASGFPADASKTSARVYSAPGFIVEREPDPFERA